MHLALKNLIHERVRFIVVVLGISFAVFLMLFQGSLFIGFLTASSRMIDSTDADLWVVARGVPCFEYSSPLPSRFCDISKGIEGVINVNRLVIGFSPLQKPSGIKKLALVIGAEQELRGNLPLPLQQRIKIPEAVLIDKSRAESLEITSTPISIEISKKRATVIGIVNGFSTFLGFPYVFTHYNDALSYLNYSSEETCYLLVKVKPTANIKEIQNHLRKRFPEADVWTQEEFSQKAKEFWLTRTGAGEGILLAAFLGFIVGLVIVSQTIYAITIEHIEEYATLKALGASPWYIIKIVLVQSFISASLGTILGILLSYPMINLAKTNIAWIYLPYWLPYVVTIIAQLMCAVASVASLRKAISIEPGRVFRA